MELRGTTNAGYVAFGLELRSSFPLPGMTPEASEGLPVLALELTSPAELQSSWSGKQGGPDWQGQLGDGRTLTIERGDGGDLLFAYGDSAHFRLDVDAGRLQCAPRDVARLDWMRVLLSRVLPNVSLAHDREALHASAVESPRGVVAIAAPSGMGKSTLALELMRRGWPLFCDDVLVLAAGAGGVHAHPGAPHMNIACDRADEWAATEPQDDDATLGAFAGEQWIAIGAAARGPRAVAAICLLERDADLTLDARPLPSTPLPLAPYMLGLPDWDSDAGRERSRFALYSDLVDDASLLRLTGGAEDRPEDIANLLERTLERSCALAAGGAA